jgi:hypothetical protein
MALTAKSQSDSRVRFAMRQPYGQGYGDLVILPSVIFHFWFLD